ncbi:hypothetical protein DZF79_28535 [Vibrio parahaemolyticus]|nr:hypothetical protein [Vibrio parahaemolyticus]
MTRKTYLLPLLAIGLISPPASANLYSIEKTSSPYIGETLLIEAPFAYISGLEHCNTLPTNIAKNTECLMNPKASHHATMLGNSCTNCLDDTRLTKPRTLNYKKIATLEVVGSFNVQKSNENPIEWMLNLNRKHNFILLKDEEENMIEMSEIEFSLFKEWDGKMSREERSIVSSYEHYPVMKGVYKTFCFFDMEKHQGEFLGNASKLINDFEMQDSITLSSYEHCPPNKTDGFILRAKDFDSYLTFHYYLNEWGVYGRWID